MSRQYNMYNVQLSEFWKQRCSKELENVVALNMYDDLSDTASEAPSRSASMISATSTVSQQKIDELKKKLAEETKCARARRLSPPLSAPGHFHLPIWPITLRTWGARLLVALPAALTSSMAAPF